jgi:two-component system, NarL family, nitrate/nitrite response regulator NarL
VHVLVATEIRLYREGVAASLRAVPGIQSVTTAASGTAAVAQVRQAPCDVVLLDMSLGDCAAAVRALHTARVGLRVVALGMPEDGPEIIACAEAGIAGYISRDASLAEVAEALRCAMRGEAICTATVAARLIRHIELQARSRTDSTASHLTRRERDVLTLLQGGMTNKEIGKALDLQLSTVKNHVHQVLAKLGIAGREEVLQPVTAARRIGAAVEAR